MYANVNKSCTESQLQNLLVILDLIEYKYKHVQIHDIEDKF